MRQYLFNDDSSDNSENILLELQKKYPIRIINMRAETFGIDPCVLAGFRNAKGDAIIYLHSDLQDPPEVISRFN